VSDVRKEDGPRCPRCGAGLNEVVTIEPMAGDPGLIAYECSKCGYVTSELREPKPNRLR
jgi:uncharacterized Zn finger protein